MISRYFEYMEYWNRMEKEKKMEIGGERLAPSVSVKDRSLSGLVIEFELY